MSPIKLIGIIYSSTEWRNIKSSGDIASNMKVLAIKGILIKTMCCVLCCVFSVCVENKLLTPIDGAHLVCSLKPHPALAPAMHLFPQNMLVSGDENIPGVTPSPTGKTTVETAGQCFPLRVNIDVICTRRPFVQLLYVPFSVTFIFHLTLLKLA